MPNFPCNTRIDLKLRNSFLFLSVLHHLDASIGINTTKIRISIIITKWFNISVANAINVAR